MKLLKDMAAGLFGRGQHTENRDKNGFSSETWLIREGYAMTSRNIGDGTVVREFSRANETVTTTRSSDGIVTEKHRREGKLNRVNGPAIVTRLPDGTLIAEYYNWGERHHAAGPAIIAELPNKVRIEAYYLWNQLRRKDVRYGEEKPVVVAHDRTGKMRREYYLKDFRGVADPVSSVIGRHYPKSKRPAPGPNRANGAPKTKP